MFNRKKNRELSDQLALYQERKDPRYALKAGISIEGFEGEGLLDNISISGCSMESITYVALAPSSLYKVTITPGVDDKIESFSLNVMLNWTKSSESLYEAGFSLEADQISPHFRKYVELLRSRGVQPDYGNVN
jgi:hypothetical protein